MEKGSFDATDGTNSNTSDAADPFPWRWKKGQSGNPSGDRTPEIPRYPTKVASPTFGNGSSCSHLKPRDPREACEWHLTLMARGNEHVTHTPDGANGIRVGWIKFYFAAQTGNP